MELTFDSFMLTDLTISWIIYLPTQTQLIFFPIFETLVATSYYNSFKRA